MQQQIPANPNQERSRLIDHFKRAYQIIVGLAITLACTKLFPGGFPTPSDTSFWLFCTFFITVVPIFHGGDRSLDIKYLRAQPVGFWGRAAYVWDVYMLLITATLASCPRKCFVTSRPPSRCCRRSRLLQQSQAGRPIRPRQVFAPISTDYCRGGRESLRL
jgi:hypothetical protein